MFEKIKKRWNTPQPCPVCGNVIAKGRSKKATDKKELKLAVLLYILAVGLMIAWYFVCAIGLFGLSHDNFIIPTVLTWSLLIFAVVISRVFDKVSFHGTRAFDTKESIPEE